MEIFVKQRVESIFFYLLLLSNVLKLFKFCFSDQNCLSDERCIRGVCRTICNNDGSCGQGQICENRVCQVGCRSDTVCPGEQACINKQCTGKYLNLNFI